MKSRILGLALVLALLAPSCIGPNNAFNSVRDWNSKISDNKWVNELAFLGLNIVPVYSFALLGDYLIFNSIEFWGGENPISEPSGFQPQNDIGSGD